MWGLGFQAFKGLGFRMPQASEPDLPKSENIPDVMLGILVWFTTKALITQRVLGSVGLYVNDGGI